MTDLPTVDSVFDSQLFLKTVTGQPGVYRMFGARDEILYIGKARNLKKRLTSYFRGTQSLKTAALVKDIRRIEVIVTHTENEALLLECLLIKQHRPYYNVLLRDDKSYPYIVLTEHADFPRLDFYRGAKSGKQRYFGPYPSTTAVRETLNLLQKLFRLRTCQDDFFRHRKRPCLQHQIGRCTAPCVELIDRQAYQRDVKRAVLFLEGKSQEIVDDLAQQMDTASQALDFEKAAHIRDQVAMLRQIQQQQSVIGDQGDSDIIAVVARHGVMCVQVLSVRAGRLLGSKAFFPSVPAQSTEQEVLAAFLPQYYFAETHAQDIPKQIFLSHELAEANWLATALTEQAKRNVKLITHPRGERARLLELAEQNAIQALQHHLTERSTVYKRMLALQELLMLENLPQRLECFDISHSQGEATVASCVVFDETGPRKKDYRRFNIEGITAGDDYAAMKQALTRRYTALKNEEAKLPDVLIIDGGKGQLKQAEEVLEELQISNIKILGVAKGPTRKAGLETLFLSGKIVPLDASADSPALHLIQQIRDEAHRFAITGHRHRRAKTRNTSVLESIPGIGSKRRRELLRQFGGLQELKRASVEDIAKVPGISKELAKKIGEVLQNL
jgi:excinuclease ABC subunit C